jgi:hypothetical protein
MTGLVPILLCFHQFTYAKVFMSLNLNSDLPESLLNISEFPLELLLRLKSLSLLGYLEIDRNTFEEWVQHLCELVCRLPNASFRVHTVDANFTSLCLSFFGHVIPPTITSTNWESATVICNFPLLIKVVTRIVNMVDIFSVSNSSTLLIAQGKKRCQFYLDPQLGAFQTLNLAIIDLAAEKFAAPPLVLFKIQVFWDKMLCCWVSNCHHSTQCNIPEDLHLQPVYSVNSGHFCRLIW